VALSNYLTPDPTLFVFLEKLKEFQIDIYVKIQSLHLVAKIHNKHVRGRQKFINILFLRINRSIVILNNKLFFHIHAFTCFPLSQTLRYRNIYVGRPTTPSLWAGRCRM
jgi:hypothetical protein